MGDTEDLWRVGAELQIRNLVAAVAQLADTGDIDDYMALFTKDAVWEMPDNPAVGVKGSTRTGQDEIVAGVRERRGAGVQGPGTSTRHVVTAVRVDVKDEGVATSQAYWMFYANTSATPEIRSMGQYNDTFRRVDGAWRLAHRRITVG